MPTYDYQCQQCQHTVEQFHGINEMPKFACQNCGGIMKRAAVPSNGLRVVLGQGFSRDAARKAEAIAAHSHPHGDSTDNDSCPSCQHHHGTGFPCYWNADLSEIINLGNDEDNTRADDGA